MEEEEKNILDFDKTAEELHFNLETFRQLMKELVDNRVPNLSKKELQRMCISLKKIMVGMAEAPVENTQSDLTNEELNIINTYFTKLKQPYVLLSMLVFNDKQGETNVN